MLPDLPDFSHTRLIKDSNGFINCYCMGCGCSISYKPISDKTVFYCPQCGRKITNTHTNDTDNLAIQNPSLVSVVKSLQKNYLPDGYYSVMDLVNLDNPSLYCEIEKHYFDEKNYYYKCNVGAVGCIAHSVYRHYFCKVPKKINNKNVYTKDEWNHIKARVYSRLSLILK